MFTFHLEVKANIRLYKTNFKKLEMELSRLKVGYEKENNNCLFIKLSCDLTCESFCQITKKLGKENQLFVVENYATLKPRYFLLSSLSLMICRT